MGVDGAFEVSDGHERGEGFNERVQGEACQGQQLSLHGRPNEEAVSMTFRFQPKRATPVAALDDLTAPGAVRRSRRGVLGPGSGASGGKGYS